MTDYSEWTETQLLDHIHGLFDGIERQVIADNIFIKPIRWPSKGKERNNIPYDLIDEGRALVAELKQRKGA